MVADMDIKPAFFNIRGDDAKLLDKIKKKLIATHGKVSNIATIRMALRKLDQDLK